MLKIIHATWCYLQQLERFQRQIKNTHLKLVPTIRAIYYLTLQESQNKGWLIKLVNNVSWVSSWVLIFILSLVPSCLVNGCSSFQNFPLAEPSLGGERTITPWGSLRMEKPFLKVIPAVSLWPKLSVPKPVMGEGQENALSVLKENSNFFKKYFKNENDLENHLTAPLELCRLERYVSKK